MLCSCSFRWVSLMGLGRDRLVFILGWSVVRRWVMVSLLVMGSGRVMLVVCWWWLVVLWGGWVSGWGCWLVGLGLLMVWRLWVLMVFMIVWLRLVLSFMRLVLLRCGYLFLGLVLSRCL